VAHRRLLRASGGDRRRVPEEGPAGLRRGRLQTRKWQDKEGQDRYTTEIVADRMQMLGSREGSGAPVAAEPSERAPAPEPRTGKSAGAPAKKNVDDLDDDIPF